VWWYNIDSLLEGGLTWSLGGYGSPAEKPDVTTSAPPNKATIPATPYKAPKPINPLISAMNLKEFISDRFFYLIYNDSYVFLSVLYHFIKCLYVSLKKRVYSLKGMSYLCLSLLINGVIARSK